VVLKLSLLLCSQVKIYGLELDHEHEELSWVKIHEHEELSHLLDLSPMSLTPQRLHDTGFHRYLRKGTHQKD
jgi:hypothetical protein